MALDDTDDPTQPVPTIELSTSEIRQMKISLIVPATDLYSKPGLVGKGTNAKENILSEWLLRHPYLTIGFCLLTGLLLLLYFVVVVPLCGFSFQQTDADGKKVCSFNAGSE